MSVKVRFYSYDIDFKFENSVDFPVMPELGDEVNLISFFNEDDAARSIYTANMEELHLYDNAVICERAWCRDEEKNEIYVWIQLKYKRSK